MYTLKNISSISKLTKFAYLKSPIFHFSNINNKVNFKVLFEETSKLVEVEADIGEKFINVIQKYQFADMGLCGGNISCATCHIVVPNTIYPSLNEQSFEEEELLSNQPNNQDCSRLGCQTIIIKDFEDVVIKVPKPIEENKKI